MAEQGDYLELQHQEQVLYDMNAHGVPATNNQIKAVAIKQYRHAMGIINGSSPLASIARGNAFATNYENNKHKNQYIACKIQAGKLPDNYQGLIEENVK